jgi:hypothetical protein
MDGRAGGKSRRNGVCAGFVLSDCIWVVDDRHTSHCNLWRSFCRLALIVSLYFSVFVFLLFSWIGSSNADGYFCGLNRDMRVLEVVFLMNVGFGYVCSYL